MYRHCPTCPPDDDATYILLYKHCCQRQVMVPSTAYEWLSFKDSSPLYPVLVIYYIIRAFRPPAAEDHQQSCDFHAALLSTLPQDSASDTRTQRRPCA